jgi:hypothetical protein
LKASKWGLAIGLATSAIALAACGGSSGGTSTNGNSELFTTAGFQKAYDAVKAKAGDKPALQVQITQGGADFKLRDGEQATGFVYTGGALHEEKVQVIGPGSLNGTDFPFSEIDPAAIDKIVSGLKTASGISDIKIKVLTLDKQNAEGGLRWTIIAEGGGRTDLPYTADPDGSNVQSPIPSGIIGKGTPTSPPTGTPPGTSGGGVTAPNGKTPAEIAQCVQQAGGDASKIQACTQ